VIGDWVQLLTYSLFPNYELQIMNYELPNDTCTQNTVKI
jgi:hypothetical protein